MLYEVITFFVLSTAFIILLLSVGSALILLRLVKKPILTLMEKMSKVEGGDLSVRMIKCCGDEMNRVSGSFNSMVENLEKAQRQLEQCHFQQMERADRLASLGEMAVITSYSIHYTKLYEWSRCLLHRSKPLPQPVPI